MTESTTILSALAASLADSGKVNGSVQTKPAVVLWTDSERQWAPTLAPLRQRVSGPLKFGAYKLEDLQGPAIWLKCAVAGAIPEVPLGGVPPVVYLPGVSRSDLRAIESCPRDLQPLAELQYRGVFWSQANGKDWTLNAFLTSKNGGLGLDVAQDKATQEALLQALQAGVLLDQAVEDLKGRQVNAEWLHSLLAPNPARDLLVWMDDAASARQQWSAVRWGVFLSRCRADFGFDPVSDGALVAAEKLAKGEGKWAAVAELYRDSFSSFPKVYGQLAKVQITDSFARIDGNEIWLHQLHIAPWLYSQSHTGHEPDQKRKLLLHHHEIMRLKARVDPEHLSLIPLSIYFKDGRAKVELALAKSRRTHDKRQVIADRDAARDLARANRGDRGD